MSSNIKQAAESVTTNTDEALELRKRIAEKAVADLTAAEASFFHTPPARSALPFINGGLAGMLATSAIQPVDMVKVRLQL